MSISRSQTQMNNDPVHLTSFKSSQYSQPDSTEYSFNRQLTNSSNFKAIPCVLSSSIGIGSNVSISLKTPMNKNILSLTERNNIKNGFEREYHELVTKFRRRGSKFYESILKLKGEMASKDQRILELEQHLRTIKSQQSLYSSSSVFTRKLLEAKDTIRNWLFTTCENTLLYQTEEMSFQSKIVEDIYLNAKKVVDLKNQSLSSQRTKTLFEKSLNIDPEINHSSNFDCVKLINSRVILAEQQIENEEIGLVEETIEFFQNKLEVLENRIKMLTENNQDLSFKIQEQFILDEENEKVISNLQQCNLELTQRLQMMARQAYEFDQIVKRLKEQNSIRVSQLSNAFVKVNKHNSSLALQQYNNQCIIDQQNSKLQQLMEVRRKLSIEVEEKEYLIEEFKELEKKYNTLQIELSLLNEEVEIYKIQYEEKEGRIIELQNENSALVQLAQQDSQSQNKRIEVEKENELLRYKLEIVDNRFVESSNAKISLEQKVKLLEKQVLELVQKANRLEGENIQLRTIEHEQVKPVLSPIMINVTPVEEKSIIKFYQDEATKSGRVMGELKVQLSDRDNEISYLNRSLRSMRVQLLNNSKSYEDTTANHQKQQNRLKSEIRKLQNEMRQLSSHNSVLSEQWQRHKQTDQYQLEEQLNNISMQMTKSSVRIKDVELENRNLKQNIQYAVQQRKQIAEQLQKEKKYNHTLEERVKQLETKEEERRSQDNQVVHAVEELAKRESELLKKVSEIHLLNNKIAKIQSDTKEINKKLVTSEENEGKLKFQNSRLLSVKMELQIKLREQEESVQNYKVLHGKLSEIESKLKETLDNQEILQERLQGEDVEKQKEYDEEELLDRISELNEEVLNLREQMQNMTDTEIYINTVTRKDRIIKRLEEELQPFKSKSKDTEHASKQNQISSLSKHIEILKSSYVQKNEQIASLELKYKAMQNLLNTCNQSLIEEQMKYGNYEMETNQIIQRLTKTNEETQKQIEVLYSKIQRFEKLIGQFEVPA